MLEIARAPSRTYPHVVIAVCLCARLVGMKKEYMTINLPTRASVKLSRLVLKVRATGVSCFKQRLAEAMIDYFGEHPALLKDLKIKS